MPELILIDISNSTTKIARSDGRVIREKRSLATGLLPAGDGLCTWIEGGCDCDLAVLSSVVPDRNAGLRACFGDRLLVVDHRTKLDIAIDYPDPETIGADRLANAVALAAFYSTPGVVVDFGTAVTFDIVTDAHGKGPTYVGGVIAPGLEVMTDYMFQRTALLPKIDLLEPKGVVGRTTREAMLAGAVIGYRGLVREILNEIRSELAGGGGEEEEAKAPSAFHVVATGGYADLIAAKVPEIEAVNADLTLEGLRIIGLLNRRGN